MKKILVALDASPRAPEVLASAVDLARNTGGKLLLLRTFGIPVGFPAESFLAAPDELAGILEKDAKRSLDTLVEKTPRELLDGIRIKLGVAWQQICEVAREEKVDLIVIGAHGYGTIDRLLGTTAGRVVNHADRSVLVVRPPDGTRDKKSS